MQPAAPILYAEDSDDDVFLLQRAFIHAQVPNPLVTVRDGRAAIDYLRSMTAESGGLRGTRPPPGLVLLDIKMPHLTGLQVLQWIRAQEGAVARLPVLMLSSSDVDQDILPAFAAGANGYLVKPASIEDLDALAAGLKEALAHGETADWAGLRGARFPAASGTPPSRIVPS